MTQEELLARAGELARRVGTPLPPVVIGDTPGRTVDVCLVRRDGSLTLVVDPRVASLPGPVADGYLAHPLVAASLRQHARQQRRLMVLAIVPALVGAVVMDAMGFPLGWMLLAIVPPICLLSVVVMLATTRRNLLEADRRSAQLFGPGFLVPALEHMRANWPELKGLARRLTRVLPTPEERLARLGHLPATPAGRQGQ